MRTQTHAKMSHKHGFYKAWLGSERQRSRRPSVSPKRNSLNTESLEALARGRYLYTEQTKNHLQPDLDQIVQTASCTAPLCWRTKTHVF